MNKPTVQELLRVFPSSKQAFETGRVIQEWDFSEFSSKTKYDNWYNESTYDALEKAGYKHLETNSSDYTYGITTMVFG